MVLCVHVIHVICSPPQLLMENAQRRESTFLMCVNKIIEFDSKVFKSEEDRMVRFHNCKFIAYIFCLTVFVV